MKRLFLALLLCPLFLQADTPAQENLHKVAQASNAFAWDIYKKIDATKNTFFSPYSLSSALTLSYLGAKGKTAAEMAKVLSLPKDSKVLHTGLAEIQKLINGDPQQERGYALHTANGLWLQNGLNAEPTFMESAKSLFSAEVKNVDFVGATEKARQTINEWVESKTNQKIKDLIQAGALSKLSTFVITNAVYFKGEWQIRFEKKLTKKAPFFVTPNKKVSASFMENSEDRSFLDQKDFSIVSLPYKQSSLVMTLILPKKVDGLAAVEKQLLSANPDELFSKMGYGKVNLYLPKFRVTATYRMEELFASLGMPTAFTSDADFSGTLKDRKISISSIAHKAFVDVDEWGTEAAAATAIMYKTTAFMDNKPVTMRFDHPFLFLIRDTDSGLILFMGRIQNPTEKENL